MTKVVADMTVKEWYALNKVAESSLCKRMVRFREEDPGRFSRRLSEVSSWMRVTRRGPGRQRCEPVFRSWYGGKVTAGILSEVKKLMMKR